MTIDQLGPREEWYKGRARVNFFVGSLIHEREALPCQGRFANCRLML